MLLNQRLYYFLEYTIFGLWILDLIVYPIYWLIYRLIVHSIFHSIVSEFGYHVISIEIINLQIYMLLRISVFYTKKE